MRYGELETAYGRERGFIAGGVLPNRHNVAVGRRGLG